MQQAAFTEADKKRVKVVNFVAKWLNLYPHTVAVSKSIDNFGQQLLCRLFYLVFYQLFI